jgi:hypothetical protein
MTRSKLRQPEHLQNFRGQLGFLILLRVADPRSEAASDAK